MKIDRQKFIYIVGFCIMMIAGYVIAIFLNVFFNTSWLGILYLLIAGIGILKNKQKSLWLIYSILSVLIVWKLDFYRSGVVHLANEIKVSIEPKFARCKVDAIKVENRGAVKICENIPYNGGEWSEAIMYDSTGEILNNPPKHSRAWERAVYISSDPKLSETPNNREGALGEKYSAKKISGDYYSIYFCSECPGSW